MILKNCQWLILCRSTIYESSSGFIVTDMIIKASHDFLQNEPLQSCSVLNVSIVSGCFSVYNGFTIQCPYTVLEASMRHMFYKLPCKKSKTLPGSSNFTLSILRQCQQSWSSQQHMVTHVLPGLLTLSTPLVSKPAIIIIYYWFNCHKMLGIVLSTWVKMYLNCWKHSLWLLGISFWVMLHWHEVSPVSYKTNFSQKNQKLDF